MCVCVRVCLKKVIILIFNGRKWPLVPLFKLSSQVFSSVVCNTVEVNHYRVWLYHRRTNDHSMTDLCVRNFISQTLPLASPLTLRKSMMISAV